MSRVGACSWRHQNFCFTKCSLDAEGFSVCHLEICTLHPMERANFDLVVSAHARGERTLRKTRASATSEKSRIQLGTWQPRNGRTQNTSRARAFRARFYSVYYVPLPLYQSSHDCPTSATCIRPDTRTAQYLLPRWLTIRAISTRFKMDAMCVDEFASQCGIGLTATSRAPPPFARPMLVGMLRVVSREQSRIRHHDPGLAGAAPDATPPLQAKPLSRELRAQERDYAASCDARRVPAAP